MEKSEKEEEEEEEEEEGRRERVYRDGFKTPFIVSVWSRKYYRS